MTYENGIYVPFSEWDESHPNPKPEEKDLDHRRFTFTPFASQIRSAFRKGLWLGEHNDAEGEDLLAIYRSLVDVLDKEYPELVGKMYDKLRPKAERYYKNRNKQTTRK